MTTFTTSQFNYIGKCVAYKADQGLQISVDELLDLIERNKLVTWIEENICSLNFWDSDARRVMDVEFTSIASCYDFGIESDGMARLIAYCFAFIDNLPSRTIEDL
jgi:hypothetical protein